jgi:hypothetical protein
MTYPSEFPIVLPPRRTAVGRRAAIFAVGRSARRCRGGRRPGARSVGVDRGSRGAARCRLHGAVGRDGARVAA